MRTYSRHHMRIKGNSISAGTVLFDVLSVLPLLVWGIVSLAAVVAYGRMQWFAPISCAVYSTVLCAIATIQLWRRTHIRAAIYIVIDEVGKPQRTPSPHRCCTAPTILATTMMLIAFGWGLLCFAVNATAIAPAKALDSYPCGGSCGGCTVDPHCRTWAANLTATQPIVNICPPARGHLSDDSDATFSCVADGAWMLLTAVLTLLWAGCLQRRAPNFKERVGPSGHELPTVSSISAGTGSSPVSCSA